MPEAVDRACDFPGCKNLVKGGRAWLCDEHRNVSKQESDRYRAATDEYRKFLNSPAWKTTAETFRGLNPICQQFDDGQQCRWPSYATHHVSDGRTDIANRHNWRNLIAVCQHHHDHRAGDTTPHNYAPTQMPKWLGGGTYQQPPATAAQKAKAKGGIDWDAPFSIPETA